MSIKFMNLSGTSKICASSKRLLFLARVHANPLAGELGPLAESIEDDIGLLGLLDL
jgi:hypothetical protein